MSNMRSSSGSSSGKSGNKKGGNSRGQKRSGKRRRKNNAKSSRDFWGDPSKLPAESERVRITTSPAAVVQSLGPPPLTGQEQAAGHYFEAVYERAVMMAGALAAASGLVQEDE